MDAYHRYMRPTPPPSTADPYHQYQLQQPPPPQPPPRPPQGPWYSNQFHYQSPPPPPPPPPPPSQQWATPPPPPPTPPGSMPFHAVHGQFPPRPPLPHPPPQSPYPNSYPPQEWSNPNWGYQQNWSHPAHSDAEDWAARAKAWADAKAAMENQHLQSQYTPSGRLEEQSIYHNPYPPAVDSHYAENYQQPQLGHGHQQHSHSATPPQGPTLYPSEVATVSSGPSAYLPNGGSPFSARDGAMTGHANLGHHQQESLPTNASVHQQEVPSSYSSVSGHEDIADKGEKPLHWHTSAAQEGLQLSRPSVAGSVSFDKLGPYSSQPVEPVTDPADQPLQFTPKFTRERESLLQSGYAHHPNPAATASANAWTSSIVGDFSSVPSIHPSGPQHDLPVASAMPGHAAPPFARYLGTSFQPTVPSPGGSFGLGTGTALPPPAFAGDAYGVSNISERPKKAPVPNWLREEIIKNKAAITSTPLGHPKDEDHSVEDEDTDKSYRKTDEGEDKSVDSSRSAEDDDDDEDEAEVVRTAAINQEIKRVLTEVLLKVTDELFDEIATKVLNEDDLATSDGRTTISATVAPSPGKVAKAPALVDVKEAETEGVSENSGSSSTGNILGLANYASDDEDDVDRREVQNSSGPNITKDAVPLRSGDERVADAVNEASENGSPSVKMEDLGSTIGSVLASKKNNSDDVTNLSDGKGDDMKKPDEMVKSASGGSIDGMAFNFQEVHDDSNISGVRDAREDATLSKHPSEDVMVKSKSDHSRDRDNKSKSGRGDSDGSKRLSTGKDSYKELDSVKDKVDRKMDENWRKGERDLRKEMTDRLDYRDTRKELHKSGERVKESQSKKRLKDLDGKDDRKETERSRRPSAREGDCRSERLKDKEEDRSRSRLLNDSRRHKRRRSSSSGSRGRNSKENSISHAKSSSDEVSDDSRRKSQSRRHNRSPSPMRSKRRQSRSPHSKHSQRRHSPYSSLENARERRTKR